MVKSMSSRGFQVSQGYAEGQGAKHQRAGTIAQWLTRLPHKSDHLSLIPRTHCRRRALTPTSCSLTSICVHCNGVLTPSHTLINPYTPPHPYTPHTPTDTHIHPYTPMHPHAPTHTRIHPTHAYTHTRIYPHVHTCTPNHVHLTAIHPIHTCMCMHRYTKRKKENGRDPPRRSSEA